MLLDSSALNVLDEVQATRSELADQIVTRLQKDLPQYGGLPPAELHERLEFGIELVTNAIRDGSGQRVALLSAFADLNRQRSREGLDTIVLLRAIRLSAREALTFVQQLAVDAGMDSASTLALAASLWDLVDEIVETINPVNRDENGDQTREIAEYRFVAAAVLGESSPEDVLAAAERCGLDPDACYVVLRADAGPPLASADLRPARRTGGAVARIAGQTVAVLNTAPAGAVPYPVGLGPPRTIAALRHSYLCAGRALDTARCCGETGVVSLEALGLRAAVTNDPLVGELLAERYLAPLLARGPFGEQLLVSVRTYFERGQSVDEAAKALFVHPNTLRHRLTRFEEATGSNLRDVRHLAEIWWVLTRVDLQAGQGQLVGAGEPANRAVR